MAARWGVSVRVDRSIAAPTDGLATAGVALSETETSQTKSLIAADHDWARECDISDLVPDLPQAKARSGHFLRMLDIVLATALLVLTLPLMLFCMGAVLFSGPGPVIFSQRQIGRLGDEFNCLKLRTMVSDAERVISSLVQTSAEADTEWAATQKLRDDPRVTRVGRILRRYCLDELPQLVNVLAGHMSIVGPRPIVAAEVPRYGPYFADYCSVRPELTGLWQISGKHALSYKERVHLDATYAKSKSLGLDLRILWRTIPIILTGKNV